jgi:energy-coupling factor transport system substrate-specific component
MSWPLASFTLVLAVLLIGWLAYERARPSARMVAVVATLAAITALGRDAFVALPEVKPITAMTLVVGYALGPLPGFAVGSLGMLASNMMLGQGPYTPWQMAAWGLVGLLGAALAKLTGGGLSRAWLAIACAFAALIAKEIMNVYTWTIGASHTPAALLAAVVAGLPFDITDVIASFLFGLAFAPELARLLARVRARMEIKWEPAASSSGGLVLALALVALGALGGPTRARAAGVGVSSELRYLAHAQNPDGGFGEAGAKPTSELYTAWVAIGVAATGRNPATLRHGSDSVLNALRAHASSLEGVGDDERTILALHACGAPAGSIAGHDLLAGMLAARRPDGSFQDQVNITAFAIFALRALGRSESEAAVRAAGRWIERQQGAGGGFGFAARPPGGGGPQSDVDDTAAALQALIDAGIPRRSLPVRRAVRFLSAAQRPDGGFPQRSGGESNAQSTAWAIQALIAAGQSPQLRPRGIARSAVGYLESLVAPDGSVRYSRTSAQTPVWVTAQALAALAGVPLPVGAPR